MRHLRCLARDICDVEQAEHDGALAAERRAFFVEWHSHVVGPPLSLSAAYEWEHLGGMGCNIWGSRWIARLSPTWSGGDLKV